MTEELSKHTGLRPLPAGFAEIFELEALANDASTIVVIDPTGTILWTNPAWDAFALENGGSDMLTRYGIGQCYYAGISGELRGFFEEGFQRSYADGSVFEVSYECSSQEVRRFLRLRALPIRGSGLLLEHSPIAELPVSDEGSQPVDALYLNSQGLIVQCSNCRRVQQVASEAWDWAPAWVDRPDPRMSHGLCDVCVGYYWRRLRVRKR